MKLVLIHILCPIVKIDKLKMVFTTGFGEFCFIIIEVKNSASIQAVSYINRKF